MKRGTKSATKSYNKLGTMMLISGRWRQADQRTSMSSQESKRPRKLLSHHWNVQNILFPMTKRGQNKDRARFQGPGVVLAQATSPTVVEQLTGTQKIRQVSGRYQLQIQSISSIKRTTRLLALSSDQSLASRNLLSRSKAKRLRK